MTVVTSDRSEGLWNKKLKVRIQQLLRAIKAGVPPQAFQNGVNQLPREFPTNVLFIHTCMICIPHVHQEVF